LPLLKYISRTSEITHNSAICQRCWFIAMEWNE